MQRKHAHLSELERHIFRNQTVMATIKAADRRSTEIRLSFV
jgi:hypothetical protein